MDKESFFVILADAIMIFVRALTFLSQSCQTNESSRFLD